MAAATAICILNISLRPHPLYRASGHDLYLDLPLAPWEAVLGTSVEVPTPGGRCDSRCRASTQAGQHLRLPRRGLPKPSGGEGDLFALIQIVVPSVVSEQERALYQQLSESSHFDPRAHFAEESSMRIELTEVTWFEEHVCRLTELCEISRSAAAIARGADRGGAIAPLEHRRAEPHFGAAALVAARHARRLSEDFELDTPALLLALGLLSGCRRWSGRLRELEARMPRRVRG